MKTLKCVRGALGEGRLIGGGCQGRHSVTSRCQIFQCQCFRELYLEGYILPGKVGGAVTQAGLNTQRSDEHEVNEN